MGPGDGWTLPCAPLQPPSPRAGVPGTMLGWGPEVSSCEDEAQMTLRQDGLTSPHHGREKRGGS